MLDDPLSFTNASPAGEGERSRSQGPLHVLLAAPRGFCAGVRRAIDAVSDALLVHRAPVYVRRAIVHNSFVVSSLEAQGAIFVEELDQVPEGAVVVLSAHGVAPHIYDQAKARHLICYDAVCPLVAKVHREVVKHHRQGRHVVLVGHEGHPEIVGTLGHIPQEAVSLIQSAKEVSKLAIPDDTPIGYAVQTTYSVDEASEIIEALEARFGDLAGPQSSDICYATTNRQAAVRSIAGRVDAMIVAGEHFSSNACRLAEVAEASGCRSVQLIAHSLDLDWEKLPEYGSVGITAAASTPEIIVREILDQLRTRRDIEVEEIGFSNELASFRRVKVA